MGLARILGLRARPAASVPNEPLRSTKRLAALCRELLSDRGGMSGGAVATDALHLYDSLDAEGRHDFFELLIRDFSPNPDDVGRAADAYRSNPSNENLLRLQQVVEPPRRELFRRLNMAPGATGALVQMRGHALNDMEAHPELEPVAADLGHLLTSWFNSGFLTLERIDWHSSAVVLEKLIEYEAVHQIQGWRDLRRRLEADRRCYALFHYALPNEPLIFIEVALTRGISERIQPLLDPDAPIDDPASADSAIFYSITNCQRGLRGVPFGSSLIKQVVEDLRKSLPRIKTYATLSPVPGFRKWLSQEAGKPGSFAIDAETRRILTLLDDPGPLDAAKWTPEMRQRLLSLCAFYLVDARRGGEPLDPVARFHLKNGARLERIDWLGDTSPRGIKQSGGLMVNYVYDPADLQRNHELYAQSAEVPVARRVEKLVKQFVKDRMAQAEPGA